MSDDTERSAAAFEVDAHLEARPSLEDKRAELERLQAEIAAEDSTGTDVAVAGAADGQEAQVLHSMTVECLGDMEVEFVAPTSTGLSLFQFDMQNRRTDDAAKAPQMIEFLFAHLTNESFWRLRREWEASKNPAIIMEAATEIVSKMAEVAEEPDEDAMNRTMRRIQERAEKAQRKAKMDAALNSKKRG